jgi:hypothetical protein
MENRVILSDITYYGLNGQFHDLAALSRLRYTEICLGNIFLKFHLEDTE